MSNYIREYFQTLSLTLLMCIFPNLVPASPGDLPSLIDERIAKMSPEEKVGQLFIVGFPDKVISPELDHFLGKYKPGSFLLFKRNISSLEQIRNLNRDLYNSSYKYTRLPPLIAIDQEGGSVSRLPISPAQPNALAIGKTLSPLLAQEMGYQTGLFLREVGFNMNLAPVLDVVDPFAASFIGVRSFGSDPQIVRDLGLAYSQGLLKARVIPTAKHFPGTGSLNQDPHTAVVENHATLEDMKKKDLLPFMGYAALGQNIAVMMSHLIYPGLDEGREPASFSRKISTELLRGDLKYIGLVVTDDLQMQGSRQILRPEAGALKALRSGADIVMLTWSFSDQAKAFDYILQAMKNGELPIEEVDQKLRRILYAKAFANLYRRDPKLPSLLTGATLSSKDYAKVEAEVLSKNVTSNLALENNQGLKVVRKPSSDERVCAASPSLDFINAFQIHLKKKQRTLVLTKDSTTETISSWLKKSACTVVFVAVTGPRTAGQIKQLNPTDRARLIAVNLSSPRLVNKHLGYRQVIQLYFNHKDAGKKIVQHMEDILASAQGSFAMND